MQPDQSGPPQMHIIRLPGWAAVLIGAGVLAATLALLALAATAALILLPVLLLAGLIYGWWFRRKFAAQAQQHGWPVDGAPHASRNGDIIEGEFVIIETAQPDAPTAPQIGKGNPPPTGT